MISRPNLNKPRIRPYPIGGYISPTGGRTPTVVLYECYGTVMLFDPGRSRINEVSIVGNTIEKAYENFMRIYGKYYPERRNQSVSVDEPYAGDEGRDRPHDTQARKLDNHYSCELRNRVFRI